MPETFRAKAHVAFYGVILTRTASTTIKYKTRFRLLPYAKRAITVTETKLNSKQRRMEALCGKPLYFVPKFHVLFK